MQVGSQKEFQLYDEALLEKGYTMNQLIGFAAIGLSKQPIQANKIGIVCGNGNNGADGLALALMLQEKHQVTVYLTSVTGSLSVSHYLGKVVESGIVVHDGISLIDQEDLIIDAIFGSGLNRDVSGKYYDIIEKINTLDKPVIAIDIPSGLDCNSGLPKNISIKATQTRTICAYKQGFLLPHSKEYTGDIMLCPLVEKEVPFSTVVDNRIIQSIIKKRKYDDYKGKYGKVIHITGSNEYIGAATLAAKSSVYSGSGLVCCYSSSEVLTGVTINVPECIVKKRINTLDPIIYQHYDALLIGSGLGLDFSSEKYVEDVLEKSTIPMVIDGDGLTYVAMHLESLKKAHAPVILTPHIGEFKRLHPFYNETDYVLLAKEFALKWGVILVLKGPNTIVTNGNDTYRNTTGNSAMASAGSGDVLAGMIVSFLGQGYGPIEASIQAVYLHGLCGDIVANDNYTAVASKVIELIPKAMKRII